jgi:integrative and conjugative element protein (TIGR02256 family)
MVELHSATQPEEDEEKLSPEIRSAVASLRAKFANQTVRVLFWNSTYVAVPLIVEVELPGRGPVNGVDIRKQEPILLLFDRSSFPYLAPRVHSDRQDLSKTAFPHLNATKPNIPAWFCLHRGSLDAWFAEHTVIELVERARGWLRDAARNRLVPEGDGFEPTRAVGQLGTFYYPPEENLARIARHWSENGGTSGHTAISFDLLDEESMTNVGASGYVVRQISFVSSELYTEQNSLALAINQLQKKPEFKGLFQRRLFGLLVWVAENEVCRLHFGELPETLGELETWADKLGLPLRRAFAEYLSHDLQLLAGIPVIMAVKRPAQILGTASDIELINFLVLAGGDHWPKEGSWDLLATVNLSDHRIPLTPAFARQISALPPDGEAQPTVIFGAGALGSKVASHLARSGSVAMKIVDHAKISPHNLVRHALGGRAIGLSKAEALKEELVNLYPGETDLAIDIKNASALSYLRDADFFAGYANLIDMTASNVVFNALRDATIPDGVRLYRAEIAHNGHLGLLSIEGSNRNPRLDDIQSLIFDAALEDDSVADWLMEVNSARETRVGSGGLEDIQIGLSCSSTTMRLADEVVSFHAAAAARKVRPYLARGGPSRTEGVIYRSFIGADGDSNAGTTKIEPTVVLAANAGWTIRIAAIAARNMSELMRQHAPGETGGILVGRISAPRKTIYVTRLVSAPSDSRGTPWSFTRGTAELPEALDLVQRRTGNLLTYVGEWHTHPMGGSDLSATDKSAVASLRAILDRAGHPTLVTIVTPDEFRPHLFEPDSPPIILDPPQRRFSFLRAAFGWRRW